jgi:arylsulfatase A
MATFANLVGFSLPKDAAEDSFDFLPWLKGEAKCSPRTLMVHNTKARDYAVRSGDWLLVDARSGYGQVAPPKWNEKHGQGPDDGQPIELYNLKEDIAQRHNLASKFPERVTELQALLKKIREQGHSAPRLD